MPSSTTGSPSRDSPLARPPHKRNQDPGRPVPARDETNAPTAPGNGTRITPRRLQGSPAHGSLISARPVAGAPPSTDPPTQQHANPSSHPSRDTQHQHPNPSN